MGTHFRITAYVADASVFCVHCGEERYPELLQGDGADDHEGNAISPLFQWDNTADLCCDICGQLIDDTL